jgi:hypothetical protein
MVKSFYLVELHQVWGFWSHDLDPQVTSHGGFQAMKVAKLIIDRFIFHGYPHFRKPPSPLGKTMPCLPSPRHHHFYRWYGYHSQSWVVKMAWAYPHYSLITIYPIHLLYHWYVLIISIPFISGTPHMFLYRTGHDLGLPSHTWDAHGEVHSGGLHRTIRVGGEDSAVALVGQGGKRLDPVMEHVLFVPKNGNIYGKSWYTDGI